MGNIEQAQTAKTNNTNTNTTQEVQGEDDEKEIYCPDDEDVLFNKGGVTPMGPGPVLEDVSLNESEDEKMEQVWNEEVDDADEQRDKIMDEHTVKIKTNNLEIVSADSHIGRYTPQSTAV